MVVAAYTAHHFSPHDKKTPEGVFVFVFSGGNGRAVRRGRSAYDGEKEGRSPMTLLCCGRLFLLVTRRGPRTGLPQVHEGTRETLGSKVGAYREGSSPESGTTLQSREKDDYGEVQTHLCPGLCKDARKCGREERVQQAPIGIILSDRVGGGKEQGGWSGPGPTGVFVLLV
jgi:hypothetical protein